MEPQAEATFLRSFGGDGFQVTELQDPDLRRMGELVETYVDLPLGIVDAAVIAIATLSALLDKLGELLTASPGRTEDA